MAKPDLGTKGCSKEHEETCRGIHKSSDTVGMVAVHLANKGIAAEIQAVHFAPTYEQRGDYLDCGDIILRDTDTRIEVKRFLDYNEKAMKNFEWLCVCNVASFKRASPKPAYYVLVTKDGKRFAKVRVATTYVYWTKRQTRDYRKTAHDGLGEERLTYGLDPKHVTWHDMNPYKGPTADKRVAIQD